MPCALAVLAVRYALSDAPEMRYELLDSFEYDALLS